MQVHVQLHARAECAWLMKKYLRHLFAPVPFLVLPQKAVQEAIQALCNSVHAKGNRVFAGSYSSSSNLPSSFTP